MGGEWECVCIAPDGTVKWVERWKNLVVNAGLNHALDTELSGGTQNSTWFVGVMSSTSPTIAAANTMGSHAGWAESTAYSEAARQKFVDGGVASQSLSSTASPASFSVNATAKFGGAFLTTSNTKGGATGTLYAAGAFAAVKSAASGDTLQVKATYTASST